MCKYICVYVYVCLLKKNRHIMSDLKIKCFVRTSKPNSESNVNICQKILFLDLLALSSIIFKNSTTSILWILDKVNSNCFKNT